MAPTELSHFLSVARISSQRLATIAKTLYLFTKSDMNTILLPITSFVAIAAPTTTLLRLLHALFWLEIHLMQFCVSNQSLSPTEDMMNKPWRPIPSGRITVFQARIFRWMLAPVGLAISGAYGVPLAGFLVMLDILLMNEYNLTSHWIGRNITNACAYTTLDFAATFIANSDGKQALTLGYTIYLVNAMVILTTIQAADFRDIDGDRITDRTTLPMVLPNAARPLTAFLLCAWSLCVGLFWMSSPWLSCLLVLMGLVVGGRYVIYKTPRADRTSYALYNVWLALIRIVLILSAR